VRSAHSGSLGRSRECGPCAWKPKPPAAPPWYWRVRPADCRAGWAERGQGLTVAPVPSQVLPVQLFPEPLDWKNASGPHRPLFE
jgi:hypothetical protein